jgi:hypothetical protein
MGMMRWMVMAVISAISWAAVAARAESIRLGDGSILQGEIVERKDSTVVIRSKSLGTVTVAERELASDVGKANEAGSEARDASGAGPYAARGKKATAAAAPERAGAGQTREPSDQALFFLPTAFTPPARAVTFRDFELFFLTLGYSPTDATSLTAGALFPISPEVQVLTAGLKQRLWHSRDGMSALALTGNITKPIGDFADDSPLFMNSNLVFGNRNETGSGVHAAVGYLAARNETEKYDSQSGTYHDVQEWNGGYTWGIGAEGRLTPHIKAIGEYVSAAPFGDAADFDGGLLTLGVRLHGENLSADIAGTRPITDNDLGSFTFFPMLVVSYRY